MTRGRGRRRINRALITLVLIGAVYVLMMIWLHPRLLYPFYDDTFTDPAFTVEDVSVPGADPVQVFWLQGEADAPVVFYFMGNVGALEVFRPMLDHHVNAGRSVVAMTYRGGGGTPGTSSETSLKRDALAVTDWVQSRFADVPLIVQGYSLGTGLAVHVAARRQVSAVVLSAPYDAICRLMAKRSGLPACYLPVQRWRTDHDLAGVAAPVLVLHGTADRVVPYVNGARLSGLMEDAGIPLRFVAISGAGHTDLMAFPHYLPQIDSFIAQLR